MERSGYITGTGLVTALGGSVAETMSALFEGRYIRNHSKAVLPAAVDDPRPRVTRLASAAAREAITAAGWTPGELLSDRCAIVVGTSKGPVERWLAAPPHMRKEAYVEVGESPVFGLHEVAEALAREFRHGYGPRLTLSAACASGLHALIRGTMMIRGGEADRVLVVAAEASVHPLFLGSFKRLGVLPPEGVGCRPFDVDRQGFVMSEAAAAVCLEATNSGRAIAQVERFAMGGDATHLTGSDPAGQTLRHLLSSVVDGRPVSLVHSHGTGTSLNDPIELEAVEQALGNEGRPPCLYSHKGALGHSLGAAGLVSTVLNCAFARAGKVPPNVQTRNPLPTRRVVLSPEPHRARVGRSFATAAGFGGPTAVVSLTHSCENEERQ